MSPAFLRQKSNVTPFYFCDVLAGELSRLRRLKGGQEEAESMVEWEVIAGKALRRMGDGTPFNGICIIVGGWFPLRNVTMQPLTDTQERKTERCCETDRFRNLKNSF